MDYKLIYVTPTQINDPNSEISNLLKFGCGVMSVTSLYSGGIVITLNRMK